MWLLRDEDSVVPPVDRNDSSRPLILWVVPLLLSTTTPSLTRFIGERPMTIRVEVGAAMWLGVAIVAAVLVTILSHGYRHRIRWALGVTTIAITTLFHWPTIVDAGSLITTPTGVTFLSDVIPVLLGIALLMLAIRVAGQLQFALAIGIVTLSVVSALSWAVLPRLARPPAAVSVVVAAPGAPDVVLLILDGYTGDDVLEESYGFDNEGFRSGLEVLGFEATSSARANYSFTYAAVSTMLNMNYVLDAGELSDADYEAIRRTLSGDPPLYRLFHEAGYEVALAENPWAGSYCGKTVDLCWRDGLTERVLWNLGRMTIFAPILANTRPNPFNTISLDNLQRLPEITGSARTEGVPRLTVVHAVLPHPPLLLDSHCNRHLDRAENGLHTDPESVATGRSYYIEQMNCTNTTVLRALETVLAERPDTAVIITADHGLALGGSNGGIVSDWTDRDLRSRMATFGAYRLPGCEGQVYPAMTPVNGIRIAANCALHSDFDVLADRNYWAPLNYRGEVVDVGDRLAN